MRINPAMSVWFDALRVLSIFTVVIGHYVAMLGKYDSSGLPFPVQSYGVVVMFMLSGFLILASIAAKTDGLRNFERYRFTDFLIDRGSRIFVVYWPVLIAVVALNQWFAATKGVSVANSGPANVLVNAFMLQLHPLLPAELRPRVDTMDPTWALALEWWIYLLVGWLVLVVVAQVRRSQAADATTGGRVSVWALAVLAVIAVYAVGNLFASGASSLAWFAGAALYFVYDKLPVNGRSRWLYLGAAVLLFAACMYVIAAATTGYTVTAIYSTGSYILTSAWFLCFLVFSRGCGDGRGRVVRLSGRVLKFASGYMYSLFLTHFSVWFYVQWARVPWIENMSASTKLVFLFAVANVIAIIVGLLLERHGRAVGNALKRRLSPATARV